MLVGENTPDEIRWWMPNVVAESVLSFREKKLWTYGCRFRIVSLNVFPPYESDPFWVDLRR